LAESKATNTLDTIMFNLFSRNKKDIVLLIVLLIAAGLRLTTLGSKSLWFDETASVYFAKLPFDKLWNLDLSRPETHPPLYYHGLSYWIGWFGDNETSIRLPSAFISLVNVALLYLLGHRLFNYRIGLLAAALLAVSPLHIWYAQEARMYVFMTAITLLSAILLTWDSWLAIPPLITTLTAGLYLDYTMLPIWSLLSAIWLLAWWQHGHSLRPFLIWLTSSFTAWLLFIPWLDKFFSVLETFSTVHFFIRLNEIIGIPFLTPFQYLLVMIIGTITLIPILAILQILQLNKKTERWISTAILCSFIFTTILFPVPRFFGIKRILVLIWPFIILWVAWIIRRLDFQQKRVTWSLLAVSLAMSLTALLAVPKDDWRGSVKYVNRNGLASDVVWIDPTYNRLAVTYYNLIPEIFTGRIGSIQYPQSGDIWFFAERFPGQPIPSSPTEQFLNDNLSLLEAIQFYRIEVRRYQTTEQ
jgi:uncharacterized membrane protein